MEKLGSELVQRGYKKSSVMAAFNKVRALDRMSTLEKVVKPTSERLTLVIPFDKRLPNITTILHHRWQCLTARDPKAKVYLAKPPRVSYSKTQSLQDIIVRSKLSPSSYRQGKRQASTGFKKCGQRANCSVCSHSVNATTHTCNHTGEKFTISNYITCTTPGVVYSLGCSKDTGMCARLKPQYIGCTSRPAKVRFSEHLGSAVQPSQADTTKPVGVHFRSAGHNHSDMSFLPIEKVRSKDRFVLEAREAFWIDKYKSVKNQPVDIIEYGLNLKK